MPADSLNIISFDSDLGCAILQSVDITPNKDRSSIINTDTCSKTHILIYSYIFFIF